MVVAAKLVVPSLRPETIVRERLVALLDEAAERPLTIVSAPAGYGKTTAVATWLATVEAPAAWLSVDALDDDPRRFCAHLIAAIDDALPGALDAPRRALDGGSDVPASVVPHLVTALAERVDERLILVLDDYQTLGHAGCHALVAALADALPTLLRVIVCSRTAPPLRIGRRRALGTVAEVGTRELAFQGGESERLLNESLGLGLDAEAVAAVESRVEGWAAGLALVASSRPDTAERHEVDAYLVEEVLDGVEPRLREFLRRTSILERLSGPLCEAMLEDGAAHELLDAVCRSNLFVTVLDGGWVRYHRLFAELLQAELRARTPALVEVLHRRAAAWSAANGLPDEAMAHAGAAGDGESAAEVLLHGWSELLERRPAATVRRSIARIPGNRGELAAFCDALDTLCMAVGGADPRLVARRLDELESQRDAPGVAALIDRARISPYYGDVNRAVADGWNAWQRAGDPRARAELASPLGVVLWFAGDRDGVRDLLEPLMCAIDHGASRGSALAALALTAADDGDLALAGRYGREAVEASASRGDEALESHLAHAALAEALRLQGALDAADEELAHAARLTSELPGSVYQAFTLVLGAQLALARHDRGRARGRAAAARAIIDRYPDVGTLADRLAAVEASLEGRIGEELLGSAPTAAELRVLALLPSELTLEQIADELYVSVHTVRSHRRRIYRRLGATSRATAVAIAHERNLV